MSISGNLRTMELSELLQWVAQGQRTGTLVIEGGDASKRIYFDQGRIIASGSTMESEQLGHFLVSHGYITEEELTKAVGIQEETGMLLGKILVTIGGISEEDLMELLVIKTEESIYNLFTWEEAEFRFLDGESLERGMIPMSLDVTALTLQGMNRLDEWTRIRKVIPSDQAVPVGVANLGDDSLSAGDRHILAAVDDVRSIAEICRETHSSEFQVSRLLLRELNAGRVKVVAPRIVGTAPSPEATPAAPAAPAEPQQIDGAALCRQAKGHLSANRFEAGLRALRAARTLEPHSREVRESVARGEQAIQAHLRAEGLDTSSVPVLEKRLEEMTDVPLTPEEGYLLTRVDGSQSIDSLVKLGPLDRIEAEMMFHRLMQSGHVRLRSGD